jgi:hypothetical protein
VFVQSYIFHHFNLVKGRQLVTCVIQFIVKTVLLFLSSVFDFL